MSHSMNDHVWELKTILAAWLAKSNAEGSNPKLEGCTGMVHAVQKHANLLATHDVVVLTDGYENQRKDTLTVGRNDDGSPIDVNMQECWERSQGFKGEYLINVASYLMHVCGASSTLSGWGGRGADGTAHDQAPQLPRGRRPQGRQHCRHSRHRPPAPRQRCAHAQGARPRAPAGGHQGAALARGRAPRRHGGRRDSPHGADDVAIGVAGPRRLEMPWDAESARKAAEDVEKEMAPDFPRIPTNPALTKLARAHLLWYALPAWAPRALASAAIISAKQYMGKRLLHLLMRRHRNVGVEHVPQQDALQVGCRRLFGERGQERRRAGGARTWARR